MKKVAVIFVVFTFCKTAVAQNVGIGVPVPTQKLDVAGNLKVSGAIMPGGTAGAPGQVLRSRGVNTAPAWENSAYTGAGRFYLSINSNSRSGSSFVGRGGFILDGITNPTIQEDSLDYFNVNTTGTDITVSGAGLTNNFITVNKAGLYHFEGTIRYFAISNLNVNMFAKANLAFVANQPSGNSDINLILFEDLMEKNGGQEAGGTINIYSVVSKFQLNIHLKAGSTCTFITGFNNLRFPSGTDLLALGIAGIGYISGHLIA